MTITYFEHYPHYMGTKNMSVTFTEKQFDKLIEMAKAAIKEDKAGGDDEAYEALDDYINAQTKKQKTGTSYAMTEALVGCFDSPRRPSSIVSALNKKGVWSGEWEEGSHAFSSKGGRVARNAVEKIEAKHCMDEW